MVDIDANARVDPIAREAMQPEQGPWTAAKRHLHIRGYRSVRKLSMVTRDGRDYAVVRAKRLTHIYLLLVDEKRRTIVDRQALNRRPQSEMLPDTPLHAVVRSLRRAGYTQIAELRYVLTPRGDFYAAAATMDGIRYLPHISDESARVVDRRVLRTGRAA